jgi:hypothetical protein
MAFPFLSVAGGLLSGLGSLFGGGETARAAEQNRRALEDFKNEGMGYITDAQSQGGIYLGQAGDLFGELSSLGRSGANLYADAMGLNGAEGNQRATAAFQTGPGYEFTLNQGLDALERRASAQGRLQSGQTGIDTLNYATGLADQTYGNWLSRLGGYNDMFRQGISGQAGSLSDLASLATGTADRKLNLGSEVLNGMMDATNQRAEGRREQIGGGLSGLGKAAGAFMGYL